MMSAKIADYIRAMPKVELHIHLEGSIRPEILLQLAQKNMVELPYETVEGLRNWYQFKDFDHFIQIYIVICSTLQDPEDFTLITYDLGRTLAQQNCRYAEITWTPGVHAESFERYLELFDGVRAGQQKAYDEFGIVMRWVPDVARQMPIDHCEQVAQWIATPESIERDVVAFGIGGPEVGFPPELFEHCAEIVHAQNIPVNPHAGETVGPASIWGAIRTLDAKRIKHGIRAIEDAELVQYLAANQILIEVCPKSNLCLGVYDSFDDYPLKELAAAGIPFTVSSDDPPMFNTTLTDDYLNTVQDCGLSLEQLEQSVLTGIQYSYLPEKEKTELGASVKTEMDELRTKFLS